MSLARIWRKRSQVPRTPHRNRKFTSNLNLNPGANRSQAFLVNLTTSDSTWTSILFVINTSYRVPHWQASSTFRLRWVQFPIVSTCQSISVNLCASALARGSSLYPIVTPWKAKSRFNPWNLLRGGTYLPSLLVSIHISGYWNGWGSSLRPGSSSLLRSLSFAAGQ